MPRPSGEIKKGSLLLDRAGGRLVRVWRVYPGGEWYTTKEIATREPNGQWKRVWLGRVRDDDFAVTNWEVFSAKWFPVRYLNKIHA